MLSKYYNKNYIIFTIVCIIFIFLGILVNIYFIQENSINLLNSSINKNSNIKKLLIQQNFIDINNHDLKPIFSSDKPMIINFWAPWCTPCIKEMPLINDFYKKNKNDIQVIGIGIDNKQNIQNFLANHIADYPIIEGNILALELSKQLGNNLGVLPYTIMLDKQGKIINQYVGEINAMQLKSWYKK